MAATTNTSSFLMGSEVRIIYKKFLVFLSEREKGLLRQSIVFGSFIYLFTSEVRIEQRWVGVSHRRMAYEAEWEAESSGCVVRFQIVGLDG